LAKIEHCQNSSDFGMYICLGVLNNVLPFFRYTLLRFREISYAKNIDFPSGIFLSNAKQKKPIVFLLFRGTMKSAKQLITSSC